VDGRTRVQDDSVVQTKACLDVSAQVRVTRHINLCPAYGTCGGDGGGGGGGSGGGAGLCDFVFFSPSMTPQGGVVVLCFCSAALCRTEVRYCSALVQYRII